MLRLCWFEENNIFASLQVNSLHKQRVEMFKIRMEFIGLHMSVDLQQSLSLKIKRGHWHYALIQKIVGPKLQYKHEFCMLQQQGVEPCFELQLVCASDGKVKLAGSAAINIKQWSMGRAKRDRVVLSKFAWLDLSIYYEYVMPATPEPTMGEEELFDIEFEQRLSSARQLNNHLKQSNAQLIKQLKQLSLRNEWLRGERERAVAKAGGFQLQHEQRKKILKLQLQDISARLQESSLIVTSLINLVNEWGHVETVAAVNELFQDKKVGEEVQK